jgi:hypothetical protein
VNSKRKESRIDRNKGDSERVAESTTSVNATGVNTTESERVDASGTGNYTSVVCGVLAQGTGNDQVIARLRPYFHLITLVFHMYSTRELPENYVNRRKKAAVVHLHWLAGLKRTHRDVDKQKSAGAWYTHTSRSHWWS